MKLYHFTSQFGMYSIIASGKIELTNSNLLEPVNMRIVDGNLISDTDYYKPVVWLTSKDEPNRLGVDTPGVPSIYDKRNVRFQIELPALFHVYKWTEWAGKNNMAPKWRKALTDGMDYETWYITESEIPICYVSEIIDFSNPLKPVQVMGYKGDT